MHWTYGMLVITHHWFVTRQLHRRDLSDHDAPRSRHAHSLWPFSCNGRNHLRYLSIRHTVSFGFLKKLQKNITKYKKSAKLAADTLYFFMQKDIMKSISYFNIKLLCAAFILSASLTHTTEIPTTPPATVAAKFSAENEHMFH